MTSPGKDEKGARGFEGLGDLLSDEIETPSRPDSTGRATRSPQADEPQPLPEESPPLPRSTTRAEPAATTPPVYVPGTIAIICFAAIFAGGALLHLAAAGVGGGFALGLGVVEEWIGYHGIFWLSAGTINCSAHGPRRTPRSSLNAISFTGSSTVRCSDRIGMTTTFAWTTTSTATPANR